MRPLTVFVVVALIHASTGAHAQVPAGRAAPSAASSVPDAATSDALRALVAAYESGINRRDADAVAATFTSTADQVFFDQPRIVGRDAIGDALRQAMQGWPASDRFRLTMTSARLVSPDLAIVETDATFSGQPPNRGTMLVRKQGQWLIESLRVYPALARP